MTKTKPTKYLVRLKCDPFVEPHSIQINCTLTYKKVGITLIERQIEGNKRFNYKR
jgi:hypothetical protein